MKNKRSEIENRFRGLAPPQLPTALKTRALAAACAVLDRPRSRDWWSELRWSRPLRYAWGVAVLLLVIGHLLVPRYLESVSAPLAPPLAASLRNERDELAELVVLPPIDSSARSLSELIPDEIGLPAAHKTTNPRSSLHKGSAS